MTEEGTHEDLMQAKKDYYKLYEAQAYYYRNNEEEKEVEEESILTGGVV